MPSVVINAFSGRASGASASAMPAPRMPGAANRSSASNTAAAASTTSMPDT